jgi:hypothetical protein
VAASKQVLLLPNQAGMPNLLDKGVLKIGKERHVDEAVLSAWEYVDELPFDFERRMLSVVVKSRGVANARPLLVCKVSLIGPLSQPCQSRLSALPGSMSKCYSLTLSASC